MTGEMTGMFWILDMMNQGEIMWLERKCATRAPERVFTRKRPPRPLTSGRCFHLALGIFSFGESQNFSPIFFLIEIAPLLMKYW